ncbi:hypothetical protein EXIGLDRAFT_847725 [Exidia glandulosa HHB12029]|uniref:Hydrophobin n=1 Tax=Exidia glandulosa HHB12029 TaxID=1314781 RepID=A0A166MNK8_EXIGL|nr:hypothetical protein EXIGLDRAFT_847725 [Exidia glandulosa HHB12029]
MFVSRVFIALTAFVLPLAFAAPQVGVAQCPPGEGNLNCCNEIPSGDLPQIGWTLGSWDGVRVECKAFPAKDCTFATACCEPGSQGLTCEAAPIA